MQIDRDLAWPNLPATVKQMIRATFEADEQGNYGHPQWLDRLGFATMKVKMFVSTSTAPETAARALMVFLTLAPIFVVNGTYIRTRTVLVLLAAMLPKLMVSTPP